jgi:hypothetical protein
MPHRPRWHADLTKIRAAVASLPTPFIDRPAVERLFGLRRRQANYLMARLAGYRIGPAAVVSREALITKLDELGAEHGTRGLAQRKTRVVEALDELRSQARPRKISSPPARRPGSALPEGARITVPGELTLLFSTPEDLLGRLMGLAQSAAGDFAAFAAALEPEIQPGLAQQAAEETNEKQNGRGE